MLAADSPGLSPGWDETDFVSATVVDAQGVPVPGANPMVTFHIDGPGSIAAVDSADNASHELFQGAQRRAYHGRCFAILRAADGRGAVTLSATADGLEPGKIVIDALARSPGASASPLAAQ
jgi:beta-galactosidase